MSLNYYAINRVLGATMAPSTRPRFGNFGVLSTVGAALKKMPRTVKPVRFTREMDKRVVEAFEAVRQGKAPDRILWDLDLAKLFRQRAKKLGVHAPADQVMRRLINIRKNPGRFRRHGIRISESTVADPQPSIVPRYAHALEFALVRLKYRYGASIDEILLDSKLVEEYEDLAREVAEGLTSRELRLGALYIRKNRHMTRADDDLFGKLDSAKIEATFGDLGTLEQIDPGAIPDSDGLIEVLEGDRYLYISRNDSLRGIVEQFSSASTLNMMANEFWRPRPERIRMRVFCGSSFMATDVGRWQLKLIHDRRPVFNWPVPNDAA